MAEAAHVRLRTFVSDFAAMLDREVAEAAILSTGAALLRALVRQDDWLPDAFAQANPDRYQQHLLHCDSRERFCVVSFVWGPGQSTPIHDHRTWGLVGMLRGEEITQAYARSAAGLVPAGPPIRMAPGDVAMLSPALGDIHKVANAWADRTSISVHVYGADIGAVRRSAFDPDGTEKSFVSGYANETLPNFWGAGSE